MLLGTKPGKVLVHNTFNSFVCVCIFLHSMDFDVPFGIFPMGNSGLFSLGKARNDRVVVPSLLNNSQRWGQGNISALPRDLQHAKTPRAHGTPQLFISCKGLLCDSARSGVTHQGVAVDSYALETNVQQVQMDLHTGHRCTRTANLQLVFLGHSRVDRVAILHLLCRRFRGC